MVARLINVGGGSQRPGSSGLVMTTPQRAVNATTAGQRFGAVPSMV